MSPALSIVSALSGCLAAVLLYLGSRPIPWAIQSIGGETEKEVAFRRQRRFEARWGLVLLFLAFALQLATILVG